MYIGRVVFMHVEVYLQWNISVDKNRFVIQSLL